jgi:membrane associated rhomboid family serine protease
MFVPLYDANRLKYIKLQYVTLSLIVLNAVILGLVALFDPDTQAASVGLGYIPAVAHDLVVRPPQYDFIPDGFTYITYTFIHANIYHLGGNMLFLWVFGDNVEDAMGHIKFLIFYFLCGAAGAFMHGFVFSDSQGPLIGASGAIFGVVTAYLMLHPRVWVWVFAFGRIPLPLPAVYLLALWIAEQFLMLFVHGDEHISWSAHVGGIIAGALLVGIFKRRSIPLFDRTIVSPRAVVVEKQAEQTSSDTSSTR